MESSRQLGGLSREGGRGEEERGGGGGRTHFIRRVFNDGDRQRVQEGQRLAHTSNSDSLDHLCVLESDQTDEKGRGGDSISINLLAPCFARFFFSVLRAERRGDGTSWWEIVNSLPG